MYQYPGLSIPLKAMGTCLSLSFSKILSIKGKYFTLEIFKWGVWLTSLKLLKGLKCQKCPK
jgi:hypothetical protein